MRQICDPILELRNKRYLSTKRASFVTPFQSIITLLIIFGIIHFCRAMLWHLLKIMINEKTVGF
jgi:hypothetical protein